MMAAVAVFGSTQWIAELDAAVRGDERLQRATEGVRLAITQVVVDGERRPGGADAGPAVWTVVVDDGTVRVRPGPADAGPPQIEMAHVRFTADRDTASAVARGDLAPQDALAADRLRVGGDLPALVRHRSALAAVEDAFAEVRSRTDWA